LATPGADQATRDLIVLDLGCAFVAVLANKLGKGDTTILATPFLTDMAMSVASSPGADPISAFFAVCAP
jgi:hypothetical protein